MDESVKLHYERLLAEVMSVSYVVIVSFVFSVHVLLIHSIEAVAVHNLKVCKCIVTSRDGFAGNVCYIHSLGITS